MGEQFAKLAADHGRCEPVPSLDVVNRLRGRWRVTCERGAIRFAAALSPRGAPRLQYLQWASELPASPSMRAAADRVVRLATRWNAAAAAKLFAEPADRDALARMAVDGGACTVGDAIDGDGTKASVFALKCAERPLELEVSLDKNGRVSAWRAYRPRAADGPYCVR
jgi:hypothetical protein